MIKNSFCKINLNLSVINRRLDGFHSIESVIYPINGIFDTIQMDHAAQFSFRTSGIVVDCPAQDNLCVKAYRLMVDRYGVGPVSLSLHKRIPFGAGLGAGSANAVAVLGLTNELFALNLSQVELRSLAAELGSDTAFFVDFVPTLVRGRGEVLEPISVNLSGYYIYMVKPNEGVSTGAAYRLVTPHEPLVRPAQAIARPVNEWREVCVNDFQEPIFHQIPLLGSLADSLYAAGAVYAAMSGSGSTVYGIFEKQPQLEYPYFSHCQRL
ncbi:MAG: 4-(cytidine 5'-diphospho)-2-C-methyl-D-erythritol kinase [Mucinivorans sp.]